MYQTALNCYRKHEHQDPRKRTRDDKKNYFVFFYFFSVKKNIKKLMAHLF